MAKRAIIIGMVTILGGVIASFKAAKLPTSMQYSDVINTGLIADRALALNIGLCIVIVGAIIFSAGYIASVIKEINTSDKPENTPVGTE